MSDETKAGGPESPKVTKEDLARGYRIGAWGGQPNYIEIDADGRDTGHADLNEDRMKAWVAGDKWGIHANRGRRRRR